ncbi:MAG: hypothetical protein RLZZ241_795 [Bacteroidota bacterium]|jgi:hypothetical protein
MKIWHYALTLTLVTNLNGQYNPGAADFGNPLNIPIILAGNFGELRSNHFHAGLDIKTQQREGLPVFSIQDGVVSRIKVDHWGYGKVIYIQHPDGYTSVYGHLQKFGPQIEQYVQAIQYRNQSYEMEAFPGFGELNVKKGDLIAYSGNTGGSAGPHLHFEVRESQSENPVNPLLFNFEVADHAAPTLERLFAYPLSEQATVNRSELRIQIPFSRQTDGTYLAQPVNASGLIGFGISSYDRQDLATNKNGVFRVNQQINGVQSSEIRFDRFSFEESRQLNTLIDYPYFKSNSRRIQKCFRDPGNRLSVFSDLDGDGKLLVEEGQSYTVTISLYDLEGNTTVLNIPIVGKSETPVVLKTSATSPYWVRSDQPASFDLGIAQVYFPAGAFYENTFLNLETAGDTLLLHEPNIPLDENFTLSFSLENIPDAKRKGLSVVRLNQRNKPEFQQSYQRGEVLSIRSKELGRYTLMQDTIPPRIRPNNFKPKQWLTNYRYLSVLIDDSQSGIDTYNAYINGEWVLMEYEPKKRTLTYTFDQPLTGGPKLDLKIVVTDMTGNTQTYETTIYRS